MNVVRPGITLYRNFNPRPCHAGHGTALVVGLAVLTVTTALAQAPRSASRGTNTAAAIARIRDEGLNRSQVMETLSYLTDVIGPRLTASPGLKRANEWTRDKMTSWGVSNAHLEAWGPFGRGWTLQRFSAQVVEPQCVPLTACPGAWSPGFERPLRAEVVYFEAQSDSDLEKYKGKLKGAIVLSGSVRELAPPLDPIASRLNETNLLRLANAPGPSFPVNPLNPGATPSRFGRGFPPRPTGTNVTSGTNVTRLAGVTDRSAPRRRPTFAGRYLSFLAKEGAALVMTPSSIGEAGVLFVASASVPTEGGFGFFGGPRVWSTNAPAMPAQVTVAVEDFNRLARMIQQGEKLKMEVDLQVKFHNDDLMAYNTIAEIPGTDLKDQVVMLGGHLDSWHAGTGATDNAAGCAATMEAMRIIKTLGLKPRRTIRIGLWSGEEQGLLGSRAYVNKHFGYTTNVTESTALRAPKDTDDNEAPDSRSRSTNSAPTRKLVRKAEYERFSAYFNLDNGGGKIRGVYLQGNEAVRPLFRRWLLPFADLGAETITSANTGGTDHQSFDGIGLPGFQFIQDPLDYGSRTHHSNEDVFERVPAEDMKQAAVILAAFAYEAAMMDERLRRKPAND